MENNQFPQNANMPQSANIPLESLTPFGKMCCSLGMIPTSYKVSMTYEEQLMWLCNYLENTVIPTVNHNTDVTNEVQNLFNQLHDYVEHYFDNLDVQQEINNKLDAMAEDGTLINIIAPYLQPYIDEQNQRILQMENLVHATTNNNPLPVNSIQEMTDTSKIYVLTTNGYAYYYNGTQWIQGWSYQSFVNNTYIENSSDLINKTHRVKRDNDYPDFTIGGFNFSTGAHTSAQNRVSTGRISPDRRGIVYKLKNPDWKMRIAYYNTNGSSSWSDDFLGSIDWTTTDYRNGVSSTFGFDCYVCIMLSKNDDSNITTEELASVNAGDILDITFLTDTTLTLKNVPADAETVGKAIHKDIKILGIGNSYTRDSIRWICKILKELGFRNVIVGHGYIGATSLQDQYESLDENDHLHSSFQYWKYDNTANATTTNNQTLDSILTDETWDVVIFQQQSDDAGQYSSFVSNEFDINDFVSYVKTKINNPNLKIGLNATWSHAEGYSSTKFNEYYDGDPEIQYNAIQTVIPQVANHMTQCDLIINSGLAVNLGRSNTYLNAIGYEMLRNDKNHLYYGIPSFMVSVLYALCICGIKVSDLKWYPTHSDDSNIPSNSTSAYIRPSNAL